MQVLRRIFNPSIRQPSFILSSRSTSNLSRPQLESKASKGPGKLVNKPLELLCDCDGTGLLGKCSKTAKCQYRVDQVPVFIKTYGCQMNVNDTSIIASILMEYGYKIVDDDSQAEIQLLMTCAIRESAESKIWTKLHQLKKLKSSKTHPLKQIGLLGCMAERLKDKVLDTSGGAVDIVAGPDAYRDLPRLFSVNKMTNDKAVNCLLSFDETYSDIRPVTSVGDVTSFVSITRGCDNLCSYCVVPFTRGRERSRPVATILEEVNHLIAKGIKEVTLLGQNVNSYRDLSTSPESLGRSDLIDKVVEKEEFAPGFKTVYKPRTRGLTFDVLLEEVAKLDQELRVRFTSPHPKDFTDQVIEVIRRYPNIGRCIHLPAQSGSNQILDRMRRGYTKEAYLDLVQRIRNAMPEITLTSDFIAGFCGETDRDHQDTLDLIRKVPNYTYIYAFPYSQREKTHAFHRMKDDVDTEVKRKRVTEILELFRSQTTDLNSKLIGSEQLVLVERVSRRSGDQWMGRTSTNIKTILPKASVASNIESEGQAEREIRAGDYVLCQITGANSQTLHGFPKLVTTQAQYHHLDSPRDKSQIYGNYVAF